MTPTEQQLHAVSCLPEIPEPQVQHHPKGGEMELVNLTPHEVKLMDGDNVVLTLPTAGVARAQQTDHKVGELVVEGVIVTVVETVFGETEGLPEPTEGVAYVVSIITANAARAQGRSTEDLLITSGPVRDDQGRIIGCRQLARI